VFLATVDNHEKHSRTLTLHVNRLLSVLPPLRHAVVSAVYADIEEKDRCAKNIVISGMCHHLPYRTKLLWKICLADFGFKPNVVKCRRLGRPTTGRVQSVLVVLSEVSQAGHLIKNAKSLRQSNDLTVRSSVFINADLTKAEALTAYHRRRRRRELAAAPSSTQPSQPRTVTDVSEDTFSQSITVINSLSSLVN